MLQITEYLFFNQILNLPETLRDSNALTKAAVPIQHLSRDPQSVFLETIF